MEMFNLVLFSFGRYHYSVFPAVPQLEPSLVYHHLIATLSLVPKSNWRLYFLHQQRFEVDLLKEGVLFYLGSSLNEAQSFLWVYLEESL